MTMRNYPFRRLSLALSIVASFVRTDAHAAFAVLIPLFGHRRRLRSGCEAPSLSATTAPLRPLCGSTSFRTPAGAGASEGGSRRLRRPTMASLSGAPVGFLLLCILTFTAAPAWADAVPFGLGIEAASLRLRSLAETNPDEVRALKVIGYPPDPTAALPDTFGYYVPNAEADGRPAGAVYIYDPSSRTHKLALYIDNNPAGTLNEPSMAAVRTILRRVLRRGFSSPVDFRTTRNPVRRASSGDAHGPRSSPNFALILVVTLIVGFVLVKLFTYVKAEWEEIQYARDMVRNAREQLRRAGLR